ncbi:MAG: TRAP transporter large permease subunit [Desulfobacteraceae bacterium]|nr:TRAP transporter large permease subunit [Desulfobacteraceae bacterium]
MEWWLILLLIFGGLIFLMAIGLNVAYCFFLICIVGAYVLWNGSSGLEQLILSFQESVATWTMLPLPLFILMGDVMFHSNVAPQMINTLDKWIGRLPGRLSLLSVLTGTVLSCLTGASMASIAMLGSALTPEMEKQGYKKPMSLGPILGSGGLAIMVPPSGLAVLVATIAKISVGKFLISVILPGIIMAVLFAVYIIVRCSLQPSIAPPYKVEKTSLKEKLVATLIYIMPVGIVLFLVVGVIWLGIATPTEAAATGTVGCVILAAIYKKLSWQVLKKSVLTTLESTGMMLLIVAGSTAFSQILSFSGATSGMIDFAVNLPLSPILIVIATQVVIFFLGMFIGPIPIIMITVPIFYPLITALGFDPIWYGVLFLINIEMSPISPPFGLSLFIMKGVAPDDTTMSDIWKATIPFLALDFAAMALIIVFPSLALWLPSVMQ